MRREELARRERAEAEAARLLEERLAETQARSDEEKKLVEDQLAEVSAALAAQKAEMAAQAEQHREDVASHRTNYWVHAVKENLAARSKLKQEEQAKDLARTDLSSAQEAFASLQNDNQQLLEEKEEHAEKTEGGINPEETVSNESPVKETDIEEIHF